MRPGRSSASSSASGMLVAIITRIRYFGGGFGRIPSARRPQRLTRPRGFFNPDSSVSRACSVPIPPPPPPPFIPAPAMKASPYPSRIALLASIQRVSSARYAAPWQEVLNGVIPRPVGPPGPTCASEPRLPSESASSKNTMTPPYRSASLRSFRNNDLTLRIPTPKNMLMNAPGSTNTYGLPVSPATASAISVLPVPGGPQSRMPPGT